MAGHARKEEKLSGNIGGGDGGVSEGGEGGGSK